jgi:DNA-binding MarR family transcriptional regulator
MSVSVTIWGEILRYETELWGDIDRLLRAAHDVPMERYEVLRSVHRQSGCRVNDISIDLAITVGATSKLVDRLEAKGWCESRPNPYDRRSSLISLTAAGRAIYRSVSATYESYLDEAIGQHLELGEQKILVELMGRLRGGRPADDLIGSRAAS